MTTTINQLPDLQCYHLLKDGELESTGPYSYGELLCLIQRNVLNAMDYIYFREWTNWKRVSEVFDFHNTMIEDFCEDGQDNETAAAALKFIDAKAEAGEELYYISTQHLIAQKITTTVRITLPQSVILTNRRICVHKPKLGGRVDFHDFRYNHVDYAIKRLKPKSDCGSFNVVTKTRNWLEVQRLPTPQLNQLERLCTQLIGA